jgi:hypothetical protein
MKPRLILPLFPILLALFMIAGSKAEAAVSVDISIGGGHHYTRGGTVVEYRTVEPGYTTWYPDSSPTYVAPTVYTTYTTSPTYVYDSAPYVYTTPSVEFNGWFGSGGSRHYGSRDKDRRNNDHRNDDHGKQRR